MKNLASICAVTAGLLGSVCYAQKPVEGADARTAPLYRGTYIAPMGFYQRSETDRLSNGFGGVLAGGYRNNWYAFEFSPIYSRISSTGSKKTSELGGSVNALLFPLDSLPNLFVIGEIGSVEVRNYPSSSSTKSITLTTAAAGLGNLFPITTGDYEFAIRTEALYRYGRRDRNYKPGGDIDAPRTFNDIFLNVGLQLPFGKKPPEAAPVETPLVVVPVETPPDTDGDGVVDSLDQCPGTPPGAAVDEKGCPLPAPPPPPPPCKTPEAGEKISLAGCGTGDQIVLRGVNFEFNKATLTVNAKTILDNVASELKAYPHIAVALDGHTDGKGSDSYNQKLSQRRAAAVRQYLIDAGIADSRMTSVGLGESVPVADNNTDEGRELNRRVELKITSGATPDVIAVPAATGIDGS